MDPSTSSKPDEPKEEPVKEEDIKDLPPLKKKRKKSRKIQRAKGKFLLKELKRMTLFIF